ncbi:peptidase inhibitor 16 [Plakobranchus ocellatus]|uniref:Peptidase inhibitor 16 n=1 Tax=Plakobranchus ocellatus TaxID=259542 RepID=A0AAV4A3X1_9GAST|nr:peptidase inhibitor 16 [Plakobranchus ocellatus]
MRTGQIFLLLAIVVACSYAAFKREKEWKYFRHAILKYHNLYRQREDACYMNKLYYDIDLETEAKFLAKRCDYKFFYINHFGQNVAFGKPQYHLITFIQNALKEMMKEKYVYKFDQTACGKSCRYTQLVWADTSALGCYAQRCPSLKHVEHVKNAWFLVCLYSPRGNIAHLPPYAGICERSPRCRPGQPIALNSKLCLPQKEELGYRFDDMILDLYNTKEWGYGTGLPGNRGLAAAIFSKSRNEPTNQTSGIFDQFRNF